MLRAVLYNKNAYLAIYIFLKELSIRMKLQQLRYFQQITRHKLNISLTAEALYASQPGISKQIGLLEEELGVRLFERNGKQLLKVTAVGQQILERAEEILEQVENIRRISAESNSETTGSLSIATTHTQARYRMPPVIREFMRRYPGVSLHLQQGTPMQIARMVAGGEVDFAIATEALEWFDNLIMMPCYRWNRSIITPYDHPLSRVRPLSLQAIAEYPIVTYVFGFTGRSQLDHAFRVRQLRPRLVFTAVDADVIKTYVKLGLGVGIIASMAYEPEQDAALTVLDAGHLFEPSITKIGFRYRSHLRRYMYDFIELFAPHLNAEIVRRAAQTRDRRKREVLFSNCELPLY